MHGWADKLESNPPAIVKPTWRPVICCNDLKITMGEPDDPCEHEADTAAGKVSGGLSAHSISRIPINVQNGITQNRTEEEMQSIQPFGQIKPNNIKYGIPL